MDAGIVLRDIHASAPPSWWPPAPGWWLVVALLIVAAVAIMLWRQSHVRRRQRAQASFDDALAAASTPPAQVAAMSELLRRAARRRDPSADRLRGDAWLAFLDGEGDNRTRGERAVAAAQSFAQDGRLLLDGGFRPDLDPTEVKALRAIARARFVAWMMAR